MAEHKATTQRADGSTISMLIEEPDEWLQLADLRGFAPPGFDTELEEVTHLSSPKGQREYLGGRSAPQTLTATLAFAPGSETVTALFEARGQLRRFRVEYSNGVEQEFDAIVQSWAPGDSGANAWTGTLTLQISGEIVEVAP